MSKTIKYYLDLCLKCGACSKFCPSGIDVVDIIVAAKSEYFKKNPFERIKTLFLKYFVFGLFPRIIRTFIRPTKSRKFEKKVLYFGGCGSKLKGDKAVVKILNSLKIEVINPLFHCCGVPYFTRGDLKEFNNSIKSYIKILKKYGINEVVTTCASCEKTLKDYTKWADNSDKEFSKNIKVLNIYEILKDKKVKLRLAKGYKVTYHKPCNISNYQDIELFLNNIENLDYIEMKDFDKCCGLNGVTNLKGYKIFSKIYDKKSSNIINSGAKIVLTSCLGCEIALNLYSFGKYKAYDLIDFISNHL